MFWSIFVQSTAFIAAVVVLGGIVGWLTRGSVRRD
jgi:hypothetical protein